MPVTREEWLEGHYDRVAQRQRAQADTAKLLATFSAATAATLVASALQAAPTSRLDRLAAVSLGISVLFAAAVLVLDRLAEAPADDIVAAATASTTDAALVERLRSAQITATFFNDSTVRAMKAALLVQLLAAAVAGCLAALSLLSVKA
jgi:mannitol-specific phosphotransferase system IIBC component